MSENGNEYPPTSQEQNVVARHEDVVLTAEDSNQFFAFVAYPNNPIGIQVLVYPDVRGLHPFYKGLALRFAESGITAVAIDYYGRTAGLTARDDTFDFKPHVQQVTAKNVYKDARAAFDYLKTHIKTTDEASFIVGFSTGGSLAIYSGSEDMDLAGVIAFYPVLSRTMDDRKGTVLASAETINMPLLGLFGDNDPLVSIEQVQQLDEQLDKAGVRHTIITYPGTPHNFFDRRATEFVKESVGAWQQTIGFITDQSH